MTLPRAHMRMRNTLFCSKCKVINFVRNPFVCKLIGMVVYNVQTKAELFITKMAGLLLRKTFFLYFIVLLQPCGLRFTKSNWIIIFLSL